MWRIRGEHGQLPSLSPKHVVPQTVGLRTQQIVSRGVDEVPGPFAHLLLELTRRPSRIAREQSRPCQGKRLVLWGNRQVDGAKPVDDGTPAADAVHMREIPLRRE
jgi:hypothetical protein